jgi:hypothetical protein
MRIMTALCFSRAASSVYALYNEDSEHDEYFLFAVALKIAVTEAPLFLALRAPSSLGLPMGLGFAVYLFATRMALFVRCMFWCM